MACKPFGQGNCKKNECCQVDQKTQTTAVKSSEAVAFDSRAMLEGSRAADLVRSRIPA